jgi:hypothetical protein
MRLPVERRIITLKTITIPRRNVRLPIGSDGEPSLWGCLKRLRKKLFSDYSGVLRRMEVLYRARQSGWTNAVPRLILRLALRRG